MPTNRYTWLDANRSLAALGIVMIHSTTDSGGGAFPTAEPDQRVIPLLLRQLAEFSSTELFMLFSLFLVAQKLARDPSIPYRELITTQARRLLVPFVAWTVFYAVFRLLKASAFNYEQVIVDQLSDVGWWLRAFVLGDSQYHMHFLPTLFALILAVPALRLASRWPLLGIALIGCLIGREALNGAVWATISDPELRAWVFRAIKIVTYLGYGWAAFAIYQVVDRLADRHATRDLFWAGVAGLAILTALKLPAMWWVIQGGEWVGRPDLAYFGHYLTAPVVLLMFASLRYTHLPPVFNKTAQYTFGVYLVHPAWIDVVDITVLSLGLPLLPTQLVLLKWGVALPMSVLTTMALALTPLAWTVGLGGAKRKRLRFGRHGSAAAAGNPDKRAAR